MVRAGARAIDIVGIHVPLAFLNRGGRADRGTCVLRRVATLPSLGCRTCEGSNSAYAARRMRNDIVSNDAILVMLQRDMWRGWRCRIIIWSRFEAIFHCRCEAVALTPDGESGAAVVIHVIACRIGHCGWN